MSEHIVLLAYHILFVLSISKATLMKFLFAFLCIAGLVLACGGGSDTPADGGNARTTAANDDGPDGKSIYKQYCVTCHGLYGNMGASGAFNLTTSELSVPERITVIKKGRGAMTPFESLLDEAEIKAVAEYTLELKQ